MNHRGVSLVELVMTIGISAMVILFAGGVFYGMTEQKRQLDLQNSALSLKVDIVNNLVDETAWQYTFNAAENNDTQNPVFNCIATESCTSTSKFVIKNGQDEIFFDPLTSATSGFDGKGRPCNSFNANVGNRICPFSIVLDWDVICISDICSPKQIKIVGQVLYKSDQNELGSIDQLQFNFELYKNIP